MHQSAGFPSDQSRPSFLAKNTVYLRLRGQRIKQRLHESQPDRAPGADELERCDVHFGRAHLAVTDLAVARELHAGDSIVDDLHMISI